MIILCAGSADAINPWCICQYEWYIIINPLESTSAAARKEAGTGLLANSISDADYFFTRAAALPLLGAIGLWAVDLLTRYALMAGYMY